MLVPTPKTLPLGVNVGRRGVELGEKILPTGELVPTPPGIVLFPSPPPPPTPPARENVRSGLIEDVGEREAGKEGVGSEEALPPPSFWLPAPQRALGVGGEV